MEKTTALNNFQVIQETLEVFMGNRKALDLAVEISVILREETKHTHHGQVFFVHTDENGALVITMESTLKLQIENILGTYLEKDDALECVEMLFSGQKSSYKSKAVEIAANYENVELKENKFETIDIAGSNNIIYTELLNHNATNEKEADFKSLLKDAVSASVKGFKAFACDPSIDNDGKLQFVPGFKPAVGFSYNELDNLAKENGLRLGNKFEYVLFLANMIYNMIHDGWTEDDAWHAVCVDSKELGHYSNSKNSDVFFELTGSRKVVNKYDLANAYKILEKDDNGGGFWLASGNCNYQSHFYPLASIHRDYSYTLHYNYGVGWFVI